MASKIECPNCNEEKGPFFLFRHVSNVSSSGEVMSALLEFPREDHIICPSCGVAGAITDFSREEEGGEEFRQATTEQINQEVKALYEGICQSDGRLFDAAAETPNVQMALNLKGLTASSTAIIESALRQGFC